MELAGPAPAAPNSANVTRLSGLIKKFKKPLKDFKVETRTWDLKLMDKQIEDIYQTINFRLEKENSKTGIQNFKDTFIAQFESCDQDKDNVLKSEEFSACMKSDPMLREIVPPPVQYAAFVNYTYTNTTGFYPILFNLIDSNHNSYINFHDFLTLRLFAFSWKRCSSMAPFIEEVNFECAMEIASGYKTLGRNTLRRLFTLGLELSNNDAIRSLDFMTYATIAVAIRIYGKINGKEDQDITLSEMNLALDSGILPMRYNQVVVNDIFKLVAQQDRPNQGIDLISFVFYDTFLRMYEVPKPNQNKVKKYNINQKDFQDIMQHYLFPSSVLAEMRKVPRHSNMTQSSYGMFAYWNKDKYTQEADHFLRSFAESEIQVDYKNTNHFEGPQPFRFRQIGNFDLMTQNNTKYTFNNSNSAAIFTQILDNNGDGWLGFYDWGNFMQIAYLFTKFDVNGKGRIPAGELYEMYSQYSDFPIVSYELRERGKRFNLLSRDLYVDLLHATILLRIDDIVRITKRRSDSTNMYEYELKNILNRVNIKYLPDASLEKCLRGVDKENVPLYDWECGIIEALERTLTFYENQYAYLATQKLNTTLANTVFINKDPQL